MKRTLSLLAATLLVLPLASAAFATDGLGVYKDQAGTINCSVAPALYSTVTLYVVARNISGTSGLTGWEASLIFDPPEADMAVPPDYTILGGMTNFLVPPVFATASATPLAYAAAMPLVRIRLEYWEPVKVGIGPCVPCSFGPGTAFPDAGRGPGYSAAGAENDLRRFYPSSNIESGTPFFYWVYYLGVEGEACPGNPQDAQQSSWGGVKSLFK